MAKLKAIGLEGRFIHVFTAETGTPTQDALNLLGSWAEHAPAADLLLTPPGT